MTPTPQTARESAERSKSMARSRARIALARARRDRYRDALTRANVARIVYTTNSNVR